jgi:FdhE protein
MAQKILQPGEIEALAGRDVPFLLMPDRNSLFSQRAGRMRQLAPGHAMGDYLEFVAKVADAQHWALSDMPPVPLPKPEHIEQCKEHGMPPLNAQTHQRDRIWCDLLRHMLRHIAGETKGGLQEIIVRLEGKRDELYEAQASKLLAGIVFGLDLAVAPLIGSALQVYWTHMALVLGRDSFGQIDTPSVCPVCASRPVTSIVRIGGQEGGYRYLHCGLCAAEWHMVRIKCTHCESTKGIFYHGIESGSKAVQAESCDECNTYLKILYMERDHQVEPTADDLASIALDLLMAETGKLRSGHNLMLIQGDDRDD